MKKLAYALLVLIFLPGAALALLINSGVISASSLKMITNTQFGIGGRKPIDGQIRQ